MDLILVIVILHIFLSLRRLLPLFSPTPLSSLHYPYQSLRCDDRTGHTFAPACTNELYIRPECAASEQPFSESSAGRVKRVGARGAWLDSQLAQWLAEFKIFVYRALPSF